MIERVPEIAELDELYGQGKFDEFLTERPRAGGIGLEEAIKTFRQTSVDSGTEFFRYAQQMLFFRELFIRAFLSRQPVSIASVGCSTGEEPFSILLSIWEHRKHLALDAFDINPDNIQAGISASYRCPAADIEALEKTISGLGIKGSDAYLIEKDDRFGTVHFTREARHRIRFGTIDILQQTLPHEYDIIFLCNLLKYLTQKGRELALANVSLKLKDNGFLFLGSKASVFGYSGVGSEAFIEALGYSKVPTHDVISQSLNQDQVYQLVSRQHAVLPPP